MRVVPRPPPNFQQQPRGPAPGENRGYTPAGNQNQPSQQPEQRPASQQDVDSLARQFERMQLTIAQMERNQRQQQPVHRYHLDSAPQMNAIFEPTEPEPTPKDIFELWMAMLDDYEKMCTLKVDQTYLQDLRHHMEWIYEKIKPILEDFCEGTPRLHPKPVELHCSECLSLMDYGGDAPTGTGDNAEHGFAMMTPADIYSQKRAGEDIGPAQRMPTKRVAFAPGPASAGAPGAPGHGVPPPPPPPAAAGPSRTSPRTGNGPTPGATPRPFPGPRPGNEGLRPPAPQRGNYPMPTGGAMRPPTDPARRTDPVPNLSAEELADSKGKEMAMKACRSLTVDAVKEDNLVV